MTDIPYKKFRLGDIFEKLPVKKAKKQNLKKSPDNEYCIPVVYAKYGDNGIMYWGKKNDFTTYNNVISIVYNGVISAGKVYAQERKTGILAESYLIRIKNVKDIPFEANLYMAIVIEHVIYPKYSRENLATWDNRVENEEIMLPVVKNNDNQIDFDYMKRYICDLMESGNERLDVFLERIGIKDCTITPQEEKLYQSHFGKNREFAKFKLGKLFKAETGDVDLQQKDVNGRGEYFINSGAENNGIKGKTDRKAKIFPANTITIDFWGNAYYRDFPYKMATHNHVFSLSGEVIKNKYVGLYLIGQMSKLPLLFSYDNMATWNKLKTVEIMLPVSRSNKNEPDYRFMEDYMRIVEKKVASCIL